MQFLGKEGIDNEIYRNKTSSWNEVELYGKRSEGILTYVFVHETFKHKMQVKQVMEYNNATQERRKLALKLEENYSIWFLRELSIKEALKDAEILVDVWGIQFPIFNCWAIKVYCPKCNKETVLCVSF